MCVILDGFFKRFFQPRNFIFYSFFTKSLFAAQITFYVQKFIQNETRHIHLKTPKYAKVQTLM